jgi:predicted dienelactone hydrolase
LDGRVKPGHDDFPHIPQILLLQPRAGHFFALPKGAELMFAAFTIALALCIGTTAAQAAGFRYIDIPADAEGPAIHGAMWSPCAAPPGEIQVRRLTLPGVEDCPIAGDKLPFIVISHGRGGDFIGHYDTAEALADAGFVVAAISHPGDTASDMSRSDDLSVPVERPTDIKRLIDFMLGASPAAAKIDPGRIGFFGFSRGGYTGLVLIGAEVDWSALAPHCVGSPRPICQQIINNEYPPHLTHDPRIKAAVIADPLAIFFTPDSYAAITVPVQLWRSERGGDGVEPEAIDTLEKNLPAPHEYHVVANSVHFSFLAPCWLALAAARPELCSDPPGFDRVAFHKELNADALAFFRTHLTGP